MKVFYKLSANRSTDNTNGCNIDSSIAACVISDALSIDSRRQSCFAIQGAHCIRGIVRALVIVLGHEFRYSYREACAHKEDSSRQRDKAAARAARNNAAPDIGTCRRRSVAGRFASRISIDQSWNVDIARTAGIMNSRAIPKRDCEASISRRASTSISRETMAIFVVARLNRRFSVTYLALSRYTIYS